MLNSGLLCAAFYARVVASSVSTPRAFATLCGRDDARVDVGDVRLLSGDLWTGSHVQPRDRARAPVSRVLSVHACPLAQRGNVSDIHLVAQRNSVHLFRVF